jgi:signal transduction histidine kinase
MLCTETGVLLAVSGLAAGLLGATAVAGRHIAELAPPGDQRAALVAEWQLHGAAGDGWSYQAQMVGTDGRNLEVQFSAIAAETAGSAERLWLVVLRDVTENTIYLHELEIYARELGALYQANQLQLRQVREMERTRDLFYSLVTHELKTPLTALKAALEMLALPSLLPPEAQQARSLLGSMERSAGRLEKMINDLLDLATAKSGGLHLIKKPVDLLDILRSVQAEMTPLALQKGVSITMPADESRPLVVEGDVTRLQQIVQNLLSNAVKAAPRDGTVRVNAKREATYGRVTVTNLGVSLDPLLAKSLFEPFSKSSANGYKAGAGLGLSVVDALVKAHQGTVSVVPRLDRVAFTFTIPLWRREQRHEVVDRGRRPRGGRDRGDGVLSTVA